MFKEILSRIGASLSKHSLPYMIIGGQAVLLYGEPRLTRDIDITLGVDVDHIDEIFAGRPRDIEDVKTVILKNPGIDNQYIRNWLREFDTSSDEKDFSKTFEKY
jgi:hypothetical protein